MNYNDNEIFHVVSGSSILSKGDGISRIMKLHKNYLYIIVLMSAYIHSQYLLQRITSDFFQNTKHETPLSWKTIPSQHTELEEEQVHGLSEEEVLEEHLDKSDYYDNDTVFYCHSDNVSLSYEFDLCDDQMYTLLLCPYVINSEGRNPFVQYGLVPGDNDAWTFPQFSFRCASNIVHEDEERSAKQVYFENECMKYLLSFAEPTEDAEQLFEGLYKGYRVDGTTIYVILNMEGFQMREKQSHVLATIDEIVNLHACRTKAIESSVYSLFYQERELLHLYNGLRQPIPCPIVGYKCFENDEGIYENQKEMGEDMMSLLDERMEHPLIGDSFLFSRDLLQKDEAFQRYALFIQGGDSLEGGISPLTPLNGEEEGGDSPLTPLGQEDVSIEDKNDSPLVEENAEEEDEGFSLGKVIPTIVEYTQKRSNPSEKGGKGGDSPFEEGGKGGDSPLYFQQNIGDQVHAFWSLPSASYFVEL